MKKQQLIVYMFAIRSKSIVYIFVILLETK
jgi:hypothetical protein